VLELAVVSHPPRAYGLNITEKAQTGSKFIWG
jgi:hypothetical protein